MYEIKLSTEKNRSLSLSTMRCIKGLDHFHYLVSQRNERGRFCALKSDLTHRFFRNAGTKSGSLRFSQFSGCWLIFSVYILWVLTFPLYFLGTVYFGDGQVHGNFFLPKMFMSIHPIFKKSLFHAWNLSEKSCDPTNKSDKLWLSLI
jgi:hypothetical protein